MANTRAARTCDDGGECRPIHVRHYGSLITKPSSSPYSHSSYAIFFFASYQANNNIQFTAIDTLCPIAGIAFTMINVRVGLGWAQRAHPSDQASSAGVGQRRFAEQSFAMRPVAVDITQVVHREDDLGQPVKIRTNDYSV